MKDEPNKVGEALMRLLPKLKTEELADVTVVARCAVNLDALDRERVLMNALNDLYDACIDEAEKRLSHARLAAVMRAEGAGNAH